jgi:hypothetical protein
VQHDALMGHINSLRLSGYDLTVIEGYDAGVTAPSCYLLALVDADGVVYVIGGFYEANKGIEWEAAQMKAVRQLAAPELMTRDDPEPLADPAIFRTSNKGKLVGKSIAEMFAEEGIHMQRGNNAVLNGILKVKAHLLPKMARINPFTGVLGAPMIYFSDKLPFIGDEMTVYRWAKARDDSTIDKPVDGKDHAMDTLKYMLSKSPEPAKLSRRGRTRPLPQVVTTWSEVADRQNARTHAHRYS